MNRCSYSEKKRKIGPKIQEWMEEMNRAFSGRLLPAASIRFEENKVIESRLVSDGEIKLEKIKVRFANMKSYEIIAKRFVASSVGSSQCTWPDCKKIRQTTSLSWLTTNNPNYSLYICKFHRRRMESYFTKMCSDIGIFTNDYSSGDFEGYTALIELFESVICKGHNNSGGEESKLLQDLFLNARNFLIIVTTMINPNEEILNLFLPKVMSVILEIVKASEQTATADLVGFIQHFLEYVLFFFGVINPWDSLFSESKPYTQIGSGVGGLVGVLSLFVVSPIWAISAMGVGGLLGAAVGKDLYINKKRREMLNESYCQYLTFRHTQQNYQDVNTEDYDGDAIYLTGSVYCDTLVGLFLIAKALSILMVL